MAKKNGIARIRQFILLCILIMVAMSTWLARERSTDWNNTLWVAVFPINGDQSDSAAKYIDALDVDDFRPVEDFFQTELNRYGVTLDEPIHIDLRSELDERPPAPPTAGSVLSVIRWSLVMRYWTWRVEREEKGRVTPDIKIFMVYFDPETHDRLPHSVGVQKGLFGVVNAFASVRQRGSNLVVLSHELLHTVGATDKYDLATGLPRHPEGYANPNAEPLYPQSKAEIMGGRTPLSPTRAEIPPSLQYTVIGPQTATEIRWIPEENQVPVLCGL
ncbi:MAG: hypothetical protein AB8G18_18420, partial [Gammaproteobacteria bacterium]